MALALRREIGDCLGEAISLNSLGLVDLRRRHLARAHDDLTQSADVLRSVDEPYWQSTVLVNLAETAFELGRLGEAADFAGRALDGFRRLGFPDGQGNALRILSMVRRESGRSDLALDHIEEAILAARTRQGAAGRRTSGRFPCLLPALGEHPATPSEAVTRSSLDHPGLQPARDEVAGRRFWPSRRRRAGSQLSSAA
ncbi:tetratricopeptide repeat protein [Sphaerimonospora cavernae]|uniref:Tetratricopeptide repeat protein n=1 Tax=Sphaerimonospora cavernae TaxID=1740611 RepID=A0ABV6U7F9_9ACTN